MPRRSLLPLAATVILLCAPACSGGGAPDQAAPPIPLTGPGTTGDGGAAATVATTASAGDGSVDPACTDQPGRKVTRLADVEIPAFDEPGTRVDDVMLAGQKVPGFVVPAVHVPALTVKGGCTIEYDAPGGCLGAVEITPVDVPGIEVPGFEIPAARVGTSPYEGAKVDGGKATGGHADGSRADQVCQSKPTTDGTVGPVYRASVLRASVLRASILRASASRPRLCVGSECTDPVSIPPLTVPPVTVQPEIIQPATLESRTLTNSLARLLGNGTQTAYVAPADVLFDFDKATLKPEALPTLRAIAADITARSAGRPVKVEGHTDGLGAHDYNQRLSEDRARAVAAWLTGEGGLAADRVSTAGLAETTPAAPNRKPDGSDDPDGRARNRRVVISVTTG